MNVQVSVSLLDIVDCFAVSGFSNTTTLYNPQIHVTHAPLRGPLARPSLLAGLRVSCVAYVTRYFPSRVLMTLVSLLHAGVPTFANSAVNSLSFFCFVFAAVFHLTWLCASWSAGTPRLRHVRKDRPVYVSCGAFLFEISHSCFTHVWRHLLGCLSRLFIVNLRTLSAFLSALRLCPSCS